MNQSIHTPELSACFSAFAETVIPAEAELPHAAAVVSVSSCVDNAELKQQLLDLDAASIERHGLGFAAISKEQRVACLKAIESQTKPLIMRVIALYYESDVVLRAHGLDARAPHPGGYQVAETDWSLLDPVKQREPFYRDVG